jgi:hypothetical protein
VITSSVVDGKRICRAGTVRGFDLGPVAENHGSTRVRARALRCPKGERGGRMFAAEGTASHNRSSVNLRQH